MLDDPRGPFAFYYTYLNLQGKLAGGDISAPDWSCVDRWPLQGQGFDLLVR